MRLRPSSRCAGTIPSAVATRASMRSRGPSPAGASAASNCAPIFRRLTFRADHRRVTRGLQPGQARPSRRPPGRSRAIRIALYVAGILGLALVTYLIADFGAREILDAMLVIGWGLAAVTLFHIVPMVLANLS